MANQYSPWQEAGMAFQSMGDSANRTMLGLAQLRYHQQEMARQQAYDQQRLMIEGALRNAQEQRLNEQAASQKQKDLAEQAMQQRGQQIGQAGMLAGGLMTPSTSDQQGTLQNSVGFLRQQGMLPNDAVTVNRGDLVNLLKIAQQSLAQQTATSTPASAASMLSPMNVPMGGTAVDRFGNVVGMGLPPAPQQPQMPYRFTPEGIGNQVTGQLTPYPPGMIPPHARGTPGYHPSQYQGKPDLVFDPNTMAMYPFITTEGTNTVAPHYGPPIYPPGMRPPQMQTLPNRPDTQGRMQTLPNDSTTDGQVLPLRSANPQPKSQEEYDALPSGTIYVDTDGQTKRKK